jgi:CO/xanthine dehydrogenase FAD-binding subunit
MKAASFDYVRANSLAEACKALADAAPDGRIIAGGQTLVPLMAMRLARPAVLVDVNSVAELAGIAVKGDRLVIKACTRQADALASAEVRDNVPLLAEALSHVGHAQTRNRGTVGGSLANADPSAEIPLIVRTLDAEIVAASTTGTRSIAADGYFEAAMMTALAPEECLVEVRFPVWPMRRCGWGFEEISIRRSDFAIVAVAAQVELDAGGACVRIHVGIGGAAPAPLRAGPVEAALAGTALDDAAVRAACAQIAGLVDPDSDVHATADYRRRVATKLAARTIIAARDRARGG